MNENKTTLKDLYDSIGTHDNILNDPNVAHLFIHKNEVLGAKALPGLNIKTEPFEDGIKVNISTDENSKFIKPVHLCFGLFQEKGMQKIIMDVKIGKGTKIDIMAHCTFPNAIDVTHIMEAVLEIGEGAEYSYFERHIHGTTGGVKVFPKAEVRLAKNALFKTEFELIRGRVGLIDIDYITYCSAYSTMEMNARINGTEDDIIRINETGFLLGEHSTGVLTTRVAVRGNAKAEVHNKLIAEAAFARGHVDCKEIIQDNGTAVAVPIVEVKHPKAHVTHEAAIGSVDSKQLQTLMSRGLNEDEAVDLIIKGLLS